jgi:hypothetical protein
LQTAITDLAKSCGIKRILHIEFKKNESRILADFEWEASSPATIRFLKEAEESGLIQGCASLVLDATRGRETELHGLASCYSGPGRTKAQVNVKPKTELPIKNIFEGSDRPIPEKIASRSLARLKPSSLKISQVERNEMEQKRREIEAQVSVTGIVRNGISQMAILEVRGAETKSLMVKAGDTVLGALVKSIDDQQNEVRLQYQTHSEIVLRLRSGQGY